MKNAIMTEEKREVTDEDFKEFEGEGEKKEYNMDEAEYRLLDMHFKLFEKMNRMLAMIEYNNPRKRKEYRKWLRDNFKG